ncbi:MAG: hypothetical protein QOJ79_2750 [Actinomycetota bacterium]|jgi:hypothetical protein|nr:hypothetical protein [Actinomycetota bacterium]
MTAVRTATVAGLLALTACSGSSGPGNQQTTSTSPAAEPSPSALVATPPPASFAVGTYGRTVKLEGDLDGRWRLVLGPDGRYQIVSPQHTFAGTYVVTADGLLFTDAECGVGAYTVARAAGSLSFTDNGADACEERHALLAGQAWTTTP